MNKYADWRCNVAMYEKRSMHEFRSGAGEFLKHKANIVVWTDGGCRRHDRATGWVVLAVGHFGARKFTRILAQGATYLAGTSSSLSIEILAAVEALQTVCRMIDA